MIEKSILYIIVLFCASIIYTSCSKSETKSNRISRGDGKWNIAKREKIQYDSVGNIVWDSVFNDIGELNFFKSKTVNALYDYRAGVMYLNQMPELERVYRFEYYTDGDRFNIFLDAPLSDPSKDIAKFYSIQYDGFRKKVLVYVQADGTMTTTTNSNQLLYKEILTIEKD